MDKHCRICHNTSCSNHGKNISFLGDGWKCNYIPVPTNADRIRAMSDEELAEQLIQYRDDWGDYCTHKGCYATQKEAVKSETEWLQQPAE